MGKIKKNTGNQYFLRNPVSVIHLLTYDKSRKVEISPLKLPFFLVGLIIRECLCNTGSFNWLISTFIGRKNEVYDF